MYKFVVIIVGVMFISFSMHADSKERESLGPVIYNLIKTVLPDDDCQSFKTHFKNDNSVEDVQCILNLIDKIKILLLKYPASDISREKYRLQDTYRWLWYDILTIWDNSKDESVKNSIKSSWDKCLKEDNTSLIPFQITALVSLGEKNRSFLDDNLWRLFESSNDEWVVCAICQAIMRTETDDIEKRLINKSEQSDNPIIKKFIARVLTWRRREKKPEKFQGLNFPPSIELLRLPNLGEKTIAPPVVQPIVLFKINKHNSEDKINWIAQFITNENGDKILRNMKIGDTVSGYEIKDLTIENLKEGDKEITVYRMTVNNKNTNKEEFFETKR
jgi:hypothetical protein